MNKWTSTRIGEFVTDWEAGLTTTELMKKYSLSQEGLSTIVGRLRRSGTHLSMRKKRSKWSDEETSTLLSMVAEKMTTKDIASSLKKSEIVIASHINNLRKKGIAVERRYAKH